MSDRPCNKYIPLAHAGQWRSDYCVTCGMREADHASKAGPSDAAPRPTLAPVLHDPRVMVCTCSVITGGVRVPNLACPVHLGICDVLPTADAALVPPREHDALLKEADQWVKDSGHWAKKAAGGDESRCASHLVHDLATALRESAALVAGLRQERDEAVVFVARCHELGATDTDLVKHALEDQERIRTEMLPLSLDLEEARRQLKAAEAEVAGLRQALAQRDKLLKRFLDNHCQNADIEGVSTLCECKLCLETRDALLAEAPGASYIAREEMPVSHCDSLAATGKSNETERTLPGEQACARCGLRWRGTQEMDWSDCPGCIATQCAARLREFQYPERKAEAPGAVQHEEHKDDPSRVDRSAASSPTRSTAASNKPIRSGVERTKGVDWFHGKHRCPCCDFLTLDSRGNYDICEVCFWEDDAEWTGVSGPNHKTLAEGRGVYRHYGACDIEMTAHVRPPNAIELAERERWHLSGRPLSVAAIDPVDGIGTEGPRATKDLSSSSSVEGAVAPTEPKP